MGVEARWNRLKLAVQKATEAAIRSIPKRRRKPWISDASWILIEEKQKAHRDSQGRNP